MTINVKQDPNNPIVAEVLAQSIVDIADGVRRMRNTRLNERALVLLIHHISGVSQSNVRNVLNALESLETAYLKPVKK